MKSYFSSDFLKHFEQAFHFHLSICQKIILIELSKEPLDRLSISDFSSAIIEAITLLVCPKTQINIEIKLPTIPTAPNDMVAFSRNWR